MTIAPIDEHEVEALQDLLEACTGYAEQVTGYPTGPSDALSTLLQLPEGLRADRKTVLGLREDGVLAACADVLDGFPHDATTTIGLLLVRPSHRRRGLGRRLHAEVVRRAAGRDRLRVGVVDTAAAGATPFLRVLGYEPEGDALPYRYDHLESTVRHWSLVVQCRCTGPTERGAQSATSS